MSFAPASASAEPALPRSVLIINQSTSLRPLPLGIIAGIQSSMGTAGETMSYDVEHLDLYQFESPQYENSLESHFRTKYRNKPIGIIVAIGPAALDLTLKLRVALWPGTPAVFAAVDEQTAAAKMPPGVTGTAMQMTLADFMKAAQMLLPDLKRFAIVGDPFERQLYFRHVADELPKYSRDFEFIDLMGLPLDEVRRRVATLPERTAIFYTGINVDRERRFNSAAQVLPYISEMANRPIIVDVETFIGAGVVGGFVLSPDQMGRDAGKLALRILNGENPSGIPITTGNTLKPIFDWRQLQRWNISEKRLPAGSEVRFREPTLWEQHLWLIVAALAVLLLQSAFTTALAYEGRRRRLAERRASVLLDELSQMNRVVTASQLTASIAHEIRQPLAAMVASGAAGLNWLKNKIPDLDEVRLALQNIVSEGHRADDVLRNARAIFGHESTPWTQVDVNELIEQVSSLTSRAMESKDIVLEMDLSRHPRPWVLTNPAQLQQVILNLIMNAIEAMSSADHGARVLQLKTKADQSGSVLITVKDSGPGIAPEIAGKVFEPFFTTKPGGMGMGLSICKSIIDEHKGRLTVALGELGGTVFQIVLPLSENGAS